VLWHVKRGARMLGAVCDLHMTDVYFDRAVLQLKHESLSLQVKLVEAVADWLIDANSQDRIGSRAKDPEYMASLERNIHDAMQLLPKLCTGVDVNVQFHDIKGFEFTDEVAIFDLLDISLVHGWLVDPQVTMSPTKKQLLCFSSCMFLVRSACPWSKREGVLGTVAKTIVYQLLCWDGGH
jgi:hypothetical protein